MKIARVEALPLAIPYSHGVPGAKRLDFCLVRVETASGHVGWGEAFSYFCRSAVAAAVSDMIAPLAVGHDAADIEGLHFLIQKKLHIFGRFGIQAYAISGLDIALWDIAAKAAGVPLHRLLGGAQRSSVPCYASLLRYADAALAAKYAERALGEGYGAIKLHEVDEAPIAAARRVVPQGVPLMLDVNCEWPREEAVRAALRVKPHHLEWLEEPVFPPEDLAGLRQVGEASGIPIAAGENFCFVSQFEQLFEARAVSIAQPSVTKVGGVSDFRKVLASASRRGVRVAPHSPYFGPGALATLHLIAAAAPDARFEHFYLSPEASLYPGLFGKNEIALPRGPGLGLDPDPQVVRRYRA